MGQIIPTYVLSQTESKVIFDFPKKFIAFALPGVYNSGIFIIDRL
ncbi:MAG: hypothetical protein PHF37_01670 [Phycisphaerae bacterium]|nr:hypothetical protein [Phycisphaerae bacterium]